MVAGTMIVPVMDAIAKFLGDSLSPVLITWGRFFFQFLMMGAADLAVGPVSSRNYRLAPTYRCRHRVHWRLADYQTRQ